MDELEKMRKGYLWNDCEQYLEEQRVAKELLYDFNQSRPSEIEKRTEIVKKFLDTAEKMSGSISQWRFAAELRSM